ncbi:hypothetical protein M3650_09365 [Paenibacillus sp. MER TA 81-3]|uniref:hypothetical protein n=1 Tax=Paenibacillus sp. MER TA 81-3 TaxID=2939573 RepID=UPI00203BEA64|nr:hypothetical protein [Paenibacillus sp. MER TA 81-3]MCM3338847.1 hypothetical protein [Paenibacillus sp. MER TA 81-3]
MFLAIRELKRAKSRFVLIGLIMVLVACLTLIVSGLANGLSGGQCICDTKYERGLHYISIRHRL